jgi:hypothetical protein
MTGPRYKVAVVHGDLSPRVTGGTSRLQLAAHVLDRLYAHHVVATFRSEGPRRLGARRAPAGSARRLGRAGAIAAATAQADEWNADEGY